MSAHPGIPPYYNMGVNKAGLHCCCTLGANSVEGNIHMPLWRMFGSPHTSSELSDALLSNSCDRRNITGSCKIYLSLMLVSHSLSGWSFQSCWKKNGVVIMIHTGLIKLWNLQLMWVFHHLFQSLKICQLALLQRNLLELFQSQKNCWRTWFWKKRGTCLWNKWQEKSSWLRNAWWHPYMIVNKTITSSSLSSRVPNNCPCSSANSQEWWI